jgi:hypothetical protein
MAAIPAQDGSRVAGHKDRMIEAVLTGRKDLKDALRRTAKKT